MLLVFESTRPASSTNRQKCSDIRFTILRPLDVPYISKVCIPFYGHILPHRVYRFGAHFSSKDVPFYGHISHKRMWGFFVTFLIIGCTLYSLLKSVPFIGTFLNASLPSPFP